MKNKKLYFSLLTAVLTIILVFFVVNSRNNASNNLDKKEVKTYSSTKITPSSIEKNQIEKVERAEYIVYYFHNNTRCSTCHKIENYTRNVFEQNFKDKYVFKMLNIDDAENEHFINEYSLYTKSVVLVKNQNSEETKFINLPNVWNNIGSEDKFKNYIKTEMENFLK